MQKSVRFTFIILLVLDYKLILVTFAGRNNQHCYFKEGKKDN